MKQSWVSSVLVLDRLLPGLGSSREDLKEILGLGSSSQAIRERTCPWVGADHLPQLVQRELPPLWHRMGALQLFAPGTFDLKLVVWLTGEFLLGLFLRGRARALLCSLQWLRASASLRWDSPLCNGDWLLGGSAELGQLGVNLL